MNFRKYLTFSHDKQLAKRLLAMSICTFFILGILISAGIIITHSDHEHDRNVTEENCLACAHLVTAKNLLKLLCVVFAGAVFIFGCLSYLRFILRPVDFRSIYYTPVHLKVRANN